MIYAFPGAALPSWGEHLSSNYWQIGTYFLSLNGGVLLGLALGRRLVSRWGGTAMLVSAAFLAAVAFGSLLLLAPPAPAWARGLALAPLGFAMAILSAAVFPLLAAMYERAVGATANIASLFFGVGTLSTALLAMVTVESPSAWLFPLALALLAAAYGVAVARIPARPVPEETTVPLRQSARSPASLLLAVLVFFQFGNEGAMAGWLALLLVQRLGISPHSALALLALYWTSLLLGRVLMQPLLSVVRQSRLLAGSVAAASFGCLVLGVTDSRFGAGVAVVLIGVAFSAIFPLVSERIGPRFVLYHPSYYSGVFTLALAGGLLAPWVVGVITALFGLGAALLIPFAGTCMVLLLLFLLWLEVRWSTVRS